MRVFRVNACDSNMRYHDLPGLGRPLMFIHGFGCASSCDFPRIAADPALLARRCILVDLLGSGFSDHPEAFSYTMEAHAQTLSDLLDALDIPSLDLYGHSMGGAIAIMLASLRPERIHRLITSEPALDPGVGIFTQGVVSQTEADYIACGHSECVKSALASGNDVWAGSMSTSFPVAIHREARARALGGIPSWRTQLLTLTLPRTVLFGERSLPHPDVAWLPEHGIRVDVVPEAGHSMMWENPSGLAQAIHQALD